FPSHSLTQWAAIVPSVNPSVKLVALTTGDLMTDHRKIEHLISDGSNRRSFVRKLGLASILASATKGGFSQTTQPAITDVDILNFALNLEYLEAEFYTVATTGSTLSQITDVTGSGAAGATTGGAKVNFTDPALMAIAQQLAADEQNHVKLIRGALGSMAIA